MNPSFASGAGRRSDSTRTGWKDLQLSPSTSMAARGRRCEDAAYHRLMPRLPTPTLRRGLAAGAVGAGAVMSARALLRPRQGGEPHLIDWEAVRRTAYD